MNKSFSLSILTLLATIISVNVNAHTDHDRARFIAQNGIDNGSCQNRFRPCASISYAAAQANKGDTLLLAQGTYHITDITDVFYLVSDIVPALGGFQPLDNYQVQNPTQFPTTLVGIPEKYADKLYQRGFNIIRDTKSLSDNDLSALKDSVNQANSMFESQSQTACIDGRAGAFECNNISLLAHLPTAALPTNSTSANDIWGHVDLNTMKEYALLGMRNGIVVIDVSTPTTPTVVGSIQGQSTTWRDIKVYQYFSAPLNKWQAFAYATADSASEGLTIIDLNDLGNGVSLVTRQTDDPSSHNIYISGVDYSLNIANSTNAPRVHILGAQARGGSLKTYALDNPTALRNSYNLAGASRQDYTHDASSLLINDARASSECSNSTVDGCIVMLDFNEGSLRLWDHTLEDQSLELSETGYPNAQYTHSGWWTEDKQYVLLHDELDERNRGLNTTVHVFDISSLRNPQLISTWTGPTRAIDHNGFVLGNKYYMSNYERGLSILDLSDPTAPQEIAYFDTFPSSTGAGFNGAWGVYPYLPSGNILLSDIQGGLYILKDESDDESKASLSFTSSGNTLNEGGSLVLEVAKQGLQAASIDYQIILGSADAADIESALSGRLEWQQGDETNKQIELQATDGSNITFTKQLFVRLTNPSSQSVLGEQYISAVSLESEDASASMITFDQSSYTVKEIDGQLDIELNRTGSLEQAITVDVSIDNSTATGADYNLLTSQVEWAANDQAPQIVSLQIIDDDDTESNEVFLVRLSSDSNVSFPSDSLSVTILDDESNAEPTVSLPSTINVNARQTIQLSANASDPENASLSFAWTQSAGDIVSIGDSSSSSINFTAPSTAQTLTLSVTVTDDFAKTASAAVDVVVNVPDTPVTRTPATNESSGGGLFWTIGLIMLGLLTRKYYQHSNPNR